MQMKDFIVDPSIIRLDSSGSWQPLGLVDLEACSDVVCVDTLPPFPLIGLGDSAHPLARFLDAVIEPPISAEMLIRQVERAPHAAAIAVQLLRSIDGLPGERALLLESFCYGLLQGSAEHQAWLQAREPAARLSEDGRVIVERQDAVLHVVLDRAWARNAIDRSMRDQLFEAFSIALLVPEVQSIKLRATGSVFSVGGDLTEFGTTRDPATAHLIRSRTLPASALASGAKALDVHVQGACIGAGLEIAAFASRLTATPDAWFQLPELSMGLIPGAGGCVSVPRRIGRQRAALLMLSGRRINATTAYRWGLIDAIESTPQLDS